MTVLPDGRLLRDAISSDPEWWLGPHHAEQGHSAVPLVKLLDTGWRIPVHSHPDDAFAQAHLGMSNGKTEAWLVLQSPPGAAVHVGWKKDISEEQLADMVQRQSAAQLLDSLHRVEVAAGDTLFIPAGVPHSVGKDMLVLEVQQPADASILIEWDGYAGGTSADSFLGLDPDMALRSVRRKAVTEEELQSWVRRNVLDAPARVSAFIGGDSEAYFASKLLRGGAQMPAGYTVGVGISGTGVVMTESGALPITRGTAFLVPYAAGPWEVTGDAIVAIFGCPAGVSERTWPGE